MHNDSTPPTPEELDAIRAELEALGEETEDLEDILQYTPFETPEPSAALSLLVASSPQASLDDLRARRLLRNVHDALPAHTPDQVAIHNELVELGEDAGQPIHILQEGRSGLLLQNVLDAASNNSLESIAADASVENVPLEPLHLVRALHKDATLTDERSDNLRDALQHKLPTNVIPWPKRHGRTLFALASIAAVLIAVFAFALSPTQDTTHTAPSSPVAQIELQQANANLKTTQERSLSNLLAGQHSATHAGDHTLRDLRFARHKARQARMQARGRRL